MHHPSRQRIGGCRRGRRTALIVSSCRDEARPCRPPSSAPEGSGATALLSGAYTAALTAHHEWCILTHSTPRRSFDEGRLCNGSYWYYSRNGAYAPSNGQQDYDL